MNISGIYSHFGGEEFLLVHRQPHYAKIMSVIKTLRFHDERDGWRSVLAIFRNMLAQAGWTTVADRAIDNPRICLRPIQRDGVRIGIRDCQRGILGFEVFATDAWSYSSWLLDVVVELMPTRRFAARKNHKMICYEDTVGRLARKGQDAPIVPLVLIGVSD